MVATTEDGRYRIEGLEPGTYRVRAFSGEWASDRSDMSAEVEVAGGRMTRDVDRLLVPGLVIAGEVVAQGSHRPVARAAVGLRGGAALAFTDEEGRFRIEGVPAGVSYLLAEAEGFARDVCWLEARPGDRLSLRFALKAAGVVEGIVRRADGNPAGGARVETGFGSARSDERGRYAIAGIPLDASSIRVSASLGRLTARADALGFAAAATRPSVICS